MGVATQDPNYTPGLTSVPAAPSTGGVSETILKYPIDMKSDQDRIKFSVWTTNKSTNINQSNALQATPPSFTAVAGKPTVFLPIQPSITDQNSVNWGAGELNELQRQLVNASIRIQRSGNNLGDVALSELQNISDMFRDVAGSGLANIYFAEQAVGVQGLLSRITGNVLNPNLELLFQGPTLRPFNFTFKLSPRSEAEATRVKKIIRFFKENMAVRKDEGKSLFLKAPYVFGIEYLKSASELHPSINLIKKCALQSCSVDYTPLGSYMTYEDSNRTMVSYSISLQFQEIVPIYNTDYITDENGRTVSDYEIGY